MDKKVTIDDLTNRKNWTDEVKASYKSILLKAKSDVYTYVQESEIDMALEGEDKIENLINFAEKRLEYLKLVRDTIDHSERSAITIRMRQANNDYSFR